MALVDSNDLMSGERAASYIVKILQGTVFDVVSFHSAHGNDITVLEGCRLKTGEVIVKDSLVKILLDPRRSISFDMRENPKITIESERQIKIVRKLSSRDTLTRIILINKSKDLG